MSIFEKIKGWWNMLLEARVKEEYDVTPLQSAEMDDMIRSCMQIYQGKPEWASKDEHIKTVNMAAQVCSEIARLATLAIGIKVDGSARAEWLQEQVEGIYFQLREWVEYASAAGTVILKPNGNGVECVFPKDFRVTNTKNGKITGAAFYNEQYDSSSGEWYSRIEYHRFLSDGNYCISNRCRVSKKHGDKGHVVSIKETPWSNLEEETTISGLKAPLFGVLKMPAANNIDTDSPLGLPCFANAIVEVSDFDTAYSLNAYEISVSKRTVLLDSDRLFSTGKKANTSASARDALRKDAGLPDYVKIVEGTGSDDIYHEINPTLNTEMRIKGISNLLSQISYKCGFSSGYFTFDQKTGLVTATQVESDDRRTIQFIKDVRDKLENAIDGVLYALDAFADLYGLATAGEYETTYDFGDITYNREEDRARWYSYVVQGRVPFWRYLVKFEGFSEDDAKAIDAEMAQQNQLYAPEE